MDSFPSVFGIACEKKTSVADLMEIPGALVQWNLSFIRVAQDWEFISLEKSTALFTLTKTADSNYLHDFLLSFSSS